MKKISRLFAFWICAFIAAEAPASAAANDPYSRVQGENFNAGKRNERGD